ncbi:MAG: TlpA family protein disulfide reductase [Planctomycetaceae bacterium]|nr:TlpA family protein disulfide reductase [Planctomycetaceae bacterium]
MKSSAGTSLTETGRSIVNSEPAAETLPDISADVEPVPAVGDLPELTFRLPDGSGGTLADRRSRLTLVHFWASWCGPCKAQLPALKRLQERYAARGLDVLGLSLDEEQDAWRAALSRSDFPVRQGLIGPENDAGVSGVPAYWLLGPDGRIVARGYTPDELVSAIAERLGQGEAAAEKVVR